MTPLYDPFIGKILTFAVERQNAINDMRIFLDNIIIRGIRTNLVFLKHLLENESLRRGETIIDFLHLKFDFQQAKKRGDEESLLAAALLAADFPYGQPQEELQGQAGKDEAARAAAAALRPPVEVSMKYKFQIG